MLQETPASDALDSPKTVLSVQVLRGFAAWVVVYHHFMQVFFDFQYSTALGGLFALHGRIGVDLFFMISGFVMYHTIKHKNYTARNFAFGRLKRIIPAYWGATIILIAATALGIASNQTPFSQWNLQTLVLSLLFVPHGHVADIGYYPVLTVGWTLNFEMFFYMLLAVCISLTGKRAIPVAFVMLLLLPFVFPTDWIWGSVVGSNLLFEFAIGIAVYHAYQKGILNRLQDHFALGMSAFLFALAGIYLVNWWPFHAVVASALILIAALLVEPHLRRLGGRFLAFLLHLGTLSYSAYLYHPVTLLVVLQAFGTPSTHSATIGLLLATTLITYVLSYLSFSWIETLPGRLMKG